MTARPEPTLVFSVTYQDDQGKEMQEQAPVPWPGVVWMWIPPAIGMLVEVPVRRPMADGGGVRLKRCKVVSLVVYTYGSDGQREYAGEMVLTFVKDR